MFGNRASLCTILIVVFIVFTLTLTPRLRSLSAQDMTPTATATETATLTATWTETPTLVPTDIPTETSTVTATETPTETPTAAFTDTATPDVGQTASPTATLFETPTETATSDFFTPSPSATVTETSTQPSLPSEPPLTQLFTDNFDTGELYLWTLGAGWGLIPSEAGQALQVTNSDEPVTFVYNNLKNVVVQSRFQLNNGLARLSARQSDEGSYTTLLDLNGQLVLYKGDQLLASANIGSILPGTWITIRLSVIEDVIRVASDGLERIIFQDLTPLPQGTISFAGLGVGASMLLVDDVMLSVPTADLAVTVEPTTTTTVTMEPTSPPVPRDEVSVQSLSAFSIQSTCIDINPVIIVQGGDEGSLTDAIDQVNACPTIQFVIYVRPNPQDNVFGLAINTTFGIAINGQVVIYGNNSTISRNGAGGRGLIRVESGAVVELHHLTIQNGSVPVQEDVTEGYGGGISNYGTLSVFDSTLVNNYAVNGGGGISNLGALSVYRTKFINNSAGGGGAIKNDENGILTVECSSFVGNAAYFGGAIGASNLSTSSSSIDVSLSSFDDNTADFTDDIYRDPELAEIFAIHNWWGADGTPDVTETVVVDPAPENDPDPNIPNILPADPTIPNSSTNQFEFIRCRPEYPRIVPDEAVAFHVQAKRLGLPMPLTINPYFEQNFTVPLSIQPYGGTYFAGNSWRNDESQYTRIFGVHTGLDYGIKGSCQAYLGLPAGQLSHSQSWCREEIRSICDGVIVNGRVEPSPYHGGSANVGQGVSIRCFDNTRTDTQLNSQLDNLYIYDTDGDGFPNLSNIVITYNHFNYCLDPSTETLCNASWQDTRTEYLGDRSSGTVVRQGTVLGKTGAHFYDHLHLEIFLARGYQSGSTAIRLNPAIMFSSGLSESLFTTSNYSVDTYWPLPRKGGTVEESPDGGILIYGIFEDDLDEFSEAGQSVGGGATENFWSNQTVNTTRAVEWPPRMHPLLPSDIWVVSNGDLITFLLAITPYNDPSSGYMYPNPNCTLPGTQQGNWLDLDCNNTDLPATNDEYMP